MGDILKLTDNVPEEFEFVLPTGSRIKNLFELQNKLKTIDENIYNHHVNQEKNDFSSWIKDIYHNEELASKIASSSSRKEMIWHLKQSLDDTLDISKKQEQAFDKKVRQDKPRIKKTRKKIKKPAVKKQQVDQEDIAKKLEQELEPLTLDTTELDEMLGTHLHYPPNSSPLDFASLATALLVLVIAVGIVNFFKTAEITGLAVLPSPAVTGLNWIGLVAVFALLFGLTFKVFHYMAKR
jgi:hypothetical protein